MFLNCYDSRSGYCQFPDGEAYLRCQPRKQGELRLLDDLSGREISDFHLVAMAGELFIVRAGPNTTSPEGERTVGQGIIGIPYHEMSQKFSLVLSNIANPVCLLLSGREDGVPNTADNPNLGQGYMIARDF